MTRSKKLSRQMTRYLGSETADQDFARLLETLRAPGDAVPPHMLQLLENLPSFLDIVDSSYAKYEENLAVAERTLGISSEELMRAHQAVNSMVNSLGQGFLMFDAEGICGPVYSMACHALLETMPAGKPITTVLRLDEDRAERLNGLLRLAFSGEHAMSFEEIMHFAPDTYAHSQGVHIRLDYKPDRAPNGALDRIVAVATDISGQIQAQELAERRKALFESIERALHDRPAFGAYMRHATDLAAALADSERHWQWPALLREIHTLKGGAGMFRLNALANALHDMETEIKPLESAVSRTTGRDILVKHRALLQREIDTVIGRFKDLLGMDVMNLEAESYLDKKTLYDFARYLAAEGQHKLQREYIRRVCTESLVARLRSFDLLLDDLANRLNKKVQPIRFWGTDVPILTGRYHLLLESLTHIFRNIADHGIERPEDRRERNKDEAGRVEIRTELTETPGEQRLVIEIRDDGAGIDIPRLREKLHVAEPQGRWAEREAQAILDSLMTKTLTTRDAATAYSGQGLGVSAVYSEVRRLGGTMSIKSIPGRCSIFRIEVPYRLDIEYLLV